MYPFNHKRGQKILAIGCSVDMAFLAHIVIPAADAVAADVDGIMTEQNLDVDVQAVTAGLTNPAVPRNVKIKGNVSGIDGTVTVTGTNYAGSVISEELTANGASEVVGALAFRTITKVDLPAQDHTPAAQTETIAITHAVTTAGDITMAITASALGDASPKSVVIALTTDEDDVTKTAAAIVEAINADEDVSAFFEASNALGVITLTALSPAANDASLAFAFTDTDTTGVTAGSSTNGTAGVPYDTIKVGWGDVFGLPYCLTHNTIIKTYFGLTEESTAPTVTLDADEVEKNTFDLNSTPDGTKQIDIYLFI